MDREHVSLLILAGGQGRRMGGVDKGWLSLAGRPLIEHVLRRYQQQVSQVLISANRSLAAYRELGAEVVTDREEGYQGPLMGIWSGLCAASTPWVLVVPCDSPALPADLIPRMLSGIAGNDIAMAHDGERAHPVVALMRRCLAGDLGEALSDGERKVQRWYARHALCTVDFSDCPEAFANLNTPDDSAVLARRYNEEHL
ncbi:molybdenum cofactor guanylyltransferase MobA [Modicisalibacter xianhensis]|uniref:Molybdenum cofactor guanylyltransferase n=1 Tax=Modicisalibacter xianhensis TaxID=442341 RepID=A0A1I3AAS3_9GAMM|nr:molybdenum cofactor guanylyltransferase MobA [Halomonas xianhensis]SFH46411.1 molybdopterin-guanine dinucleotide biosynthesis protein A [Halomonas xianhensis]